MRYLLDTNIIILAVERLDTRVLDRLAKAQASSLTTSAICLAEVMAGFGDAEPEGYDMFLRQIEILPFDPRAADAYSRLPFKRNRFDRLIGAHAKSIGATMVTANIADFADIPELVVEDWTR